jgi:hypothetical protein
MTVLEQLAITSAIKWLKEEHSFDDPDCGEAQCRDCEATRERVALIEGLETSLHNIETAASIHETVHRLAVKERDRERIINTELKLEIERLRRILDIHSINYQLL